MDAAEEARAVPGTVTVVLRRGQLVCRPTPWARWTWIARRNWGWTAWFRTYSQTKPVSAVVLMSLFEEGAFLLRDPIANWLPEFAHPEVMARGAQGGIAKLRRELGLGASSSSGEPAATYDYRASAAHQVE